MVSENGSHNYAARTRSGNYARKEEQQNRGRYQAKPMKDLRFNFKHIQRLAAMCSVVSLIMIAASIAAAQQQPSTESQRPAQRDAQGNSISNDQIIVNTDLVTLTVTVTDSHGRYVSGLDKTDFTISDNKVPQQITFFSDADSPVSVGIVFDVSDSMSSEKIERAKEALSNFIQTSHPAGRILSYRFQLTAAASTRQVA